MKQKTPEARRAFFRCVRNDESPMNSHPSETKVFKSEQY